MTFKGLTNPDEAMSTGVTSSLTVTYHDSYIKVKKSPQYGSRVSYIEGLTTSYDASRYRYGTGSMS